MRPRQAIGSRRGPARAWNSGRARSARRRRPSPRAASAGCPFVSVLSAASHLDADSATSAPCGGADVSGPDQRHLGDLPGEPVGRCTAVVVALRQHQAARGQLAWRRMRSNAGHVRSPGARRIGFRLRKRAAQPLLGRRGQGAHRAASRASPHQGGRVGVLLARHRNATSTPRANAGSSAPSGTQLRGWLPPAARGSSPGFPPAHIRPPGRAHHFHAAHALHAGADRLQRSRARTCPLGGALGPR